MKFLDEQAALAAIKLRLARPGAAKLAVAFWGAGAGDKLGLKGRPGETTIICNLVMGGTNPTEIEVLADAGLRVLQNDVLHAKVYLFEDSAIVGSSNASSNGLSFQDSDKLGWREANILIEDQDTLVSLETWFDTLDAFPIEPEDIKLAKLNWIRRREAAPLRKSKSLLQQLRTNAAYFADRGGYLAIYEAGLSDAVGAALEDAQEQLGKRMGGYENWPGLPEKGQLFNLLAGKKGMKFDGHFERVPELEDRKLATGDTLQLCITRKDTLGFIFDKKADQAGWERVAERVRGSEFWIEDSAVVPLELLSPFLQDDPPQAGGGAERAARERAFDKAMFSLYEQIVSEVKPYRPTTFLSMLQKQGGRLTAGSLIDGSITYGFETLWERGRLDLTVEALILKPEWRDLFNEAQLKRASRRLRQMGVKA